MIAARAAAALLSAIVTGATGPEVGVVKPGAVLQAGQSGQRGAHPRASAGPTCTAGHLTLPTVPIRFGSAGENEAEIQVAGHDLPARRLAA